MQASIVIITTAAGKLQDDTASDSLDPAVTLWLAYAFISVAVSGVLLIVSYSAKNFLPAARLSQISPSALPAEVERIATAKGLIDVSNVAGKDSQPDSIDSAGVNETQKYEKLLKSPNMSASVTKKWIYMTLSLGVIVLGWIMFGLGVGWGVHGSVVAGTVGE